MITLKRDIIYTKGIATGLTVRYFNTMFVMFGKLIRIKIPYKIVGYNREYGKTIRAIDEALRRLEGRKRWLLSSR